MPLPRLKPGSVAHLQHLAGVAWRSGNIEEAERLEAAARQAEFVKSFGKPELGRNYTRADAHRSKGLTPPPPSATL